MKPLGGGNLINRYDDAMGFVRKLEFIDSIAVGMQSIPEVTMNVAVFEDKEISEEVKKSLISKERELHVEHWCEGCGKCLEVCHQKAITLDNFQHKAIVDNKKCLKCGYCSKVCSVFAIKVY
jgi:ferredoxin